VLSEELAKIAARRQVRTVSTKNEVLPLFRQKRDRIAYPFAVALAVLALVPTLMPTPNLMEQTA
jgi:hypothetical protein